MRISKEYQPKKTFAIEWGSYMYTTIPSGLKNALAIFIRIMINAFKDCIHDFLEVYLDDWIVYGLVKYHIQVLKMMLNRCRIMYISLKLKSACL